MKLIIHAPKERVVEAAEVALIIIKQFPGNPITGIRRGENSYSVHQRSLSTTVRWQES